MLIPVTCRNAAVENGFSSEIPPVKPIVDQISVLIDGGGLLGVGLMEALALPQVVAGLAGGSGGSPATLIFPFRPSDIPILSGGGEQRLVSPTPPASQRPSGQGASAPSIPSVFTGGFNHASAAALQPFNRNVHFDPCKNGC